MLRKSSIIKYLLFCFFPLLFLNCETISRSINDNTGWIEIDRIDLDYDEDFLAQDVFFTADDDYSMIFDIFYEHIKNAHLIRLSSRVHLTENKNHQFVMYRKQDGTEYIKFDIYKIEVIYRNYTISYDFISDPRRGAAFYGDDYRYFNLYNQSLDSFLINVNAEMRMIANNLSKNNDPLIQGQAFAISYCLNNNFRRFFP